MATFVVEIALRLAVEPSEGLVIVLMSRSRGEFKPIRTWRMSGRSVSPAELEDVQSQLWLEVMDHLFVGPGVQLTLHD